MSETAAAPRAKLPLWRTVRESYAWGLGHLPEVARKAWRVLAVLAGVSFVLHWVAHPYVADAGSVRGNLFSLIAIPAAIISFGAVIAVPWHRFILDGEPLPHMPLAWPPRVVSYFVWAILLSAPLYFGLLTLVSAPEPVETEVSADITAFIILAEFVVLLAVTYALVRLSIKLVAVAVDNNAATIGEIWRNTSSNFWRLFWGTLLTLLPALVVGIAIIYLAPDQGSARWLYAAANAINSIAEVLLGMVSLTFLSLAYRHSFRAA